MWLTILLAGMVGGGLWLIYPRQDLERRLMSASEDSTLAITYLNNLLRSDPQNPQLRLVLARRQAKTGALGKVHDTLRPVLASADPLLHREALWTLWDASYALYQQTPAEQVSRLTILKADLLQQLRALVQENWSVDQHRQLTRQAFALGAHSQGLNLLRQLAAREQAPGQASLLYERAAREALAVSRHELSAEFYMLARKDAPNPESARTYFVLAVTAMRASGDARKALALAEQELGELKGDVSVIEMMVHLARAAGRPDIAQRYVKQLLRMTGSGALA
jgi:hypothetical protein